MTTYAALPTSRAAATLAPEATATMSTALLRSRARLASAPALVDVRRPQTAIDTSPPPAQIAPSPPPVDLAPACACQAQEAATPWLWLVLAAGAGAAVGYLARASVAR